jgi:hypothetical protein
MARETSGEEMNGAERLDLWEVSGRVSAGLFALIGIGWWWCGGWGKHSDPPQPPVALAPQKPKVTDQPIFRSGRGLAGLHKMLS